MSEYVCFLITVLMKNDGIGNPLLVRCALSVKRDALPYDCIRYPMESNNRILLWELLPLHVRDIGKIVEVKEIFEVHLFFLRG